MVFSWFSHHHGEETTTTHNKRVDDNTPRSLRNPWNWAAGAAVFLPMFIFLIARLFNRGGGGGGEGQNSSWWNWGGEGNEGNEGQAGNWTTTFVYLWSLILFGLLVWRGNRVLEKDKDTRALFASLVLFANLAFLCAVLIALVREGILLSRKYV